MENISNNTKPRRDIVFFKGEGAKFWSTDNTEYIDLSSQTLNLLFGQAHPWINKAVIDEIKKCTFITQDFLNPKIIEAITLLKGIVNEKLSSFNLRMNDGSDSVEAAVKAARRFTGKTKILTTDKIFLGSNTQSINLRGLEPKPKDIVNGTLDDVLFAPAPYCDDPHPPESCKIENGDIFCELIDQYKDELACVLIDPILISSGICGGKGFRDYLKKVEFSCKKNNIILAFDECQTFGWVPNYLLCNHYDIDIDILILGKGIGGGFPLSVCITKKHLDILNFCEADYTFGGHPSSIAALCATIQLLIKSDSYFNKLVADVENWLTKLKQLFPIKSRGIGLINVVEFSETTRYPKAEISKIISIMLQNLGVYVRPYGNTIAIKPPLVITQNELDFAFCQLELVLHQIYG